MRVPLESLAWPGTQETSESGITARAEDTVPLRTLARWGKRSDGNTGPTGLTGRAGSTSQGLHGGGDGLVHCGEFCGPAARAAGAGAGRRGRGAQVGLAAGPRASAALLGRGPEPVWYWRRGGVGRISGQHAKSTLGEDCKAVLLGRRGRRIGRSRSSLAMG